MNMPAFDGRGGRRSGARRSHLLATKRGWTAAVGACTLLVLAGCTSTGTEAPRSSDGAAAAVTSASMPYAGVDPTATDGASDRPVGASGDAASSSAPPPATTQVPAPGGAGNIQETVPTGTAPSNAPVALDAAGDFGNGIAVGLTSIESISAVAQMPGEVAGPGIRVEVTITNGSNQLIDVGNVVVDLQDAAGTPAVPMTSGATPFSGSIDAGASASGVYLFTVPAGYSNPATISVSYNAAAPVVVFSGDTK